MVESFNFEKLLQSVKNRGTDSVIFYEETRYRCIQWNVQDFLARIHQARSFFKDKDLKQGSKIMLCLPNSPWYSVLLFVCAMDGYVIIPIDTQSTEELIKKITVETKPEIYIGKEISDKKSNCLYLKIYDIEDFSREDPLNKSETFISGEEMLFEIVYTSGSTGEPKGVMLSQKNITSNIHGIIRAMKIPNGSCLLSLLPLSHMFEQTAGLFVPLYFGAKILYPYRKDPNSLLFLIDKYKVTDIVATPAFFTALQGIFSGKYSIALWRILIIKLRTRLRRFISGGASLPSKTKLFWQKSGISVLEGYGMTEASPIIAFNQTNQTGNGVGKVLAGQEIKFAPDGEIFARGSNITSGYFNNEKITKEKIQNGWLATGDIGYQDKQGYLYITGRKKNMLVSQAGIKIFPEDIESLILQHREVKDVIATLDNQELHVVATLIPADEKLFDIKRVKNQVNTLLSSSQQILEITTWPYKDFPRLSNGKIDRNQCIKIIKNRTDVKDEHLVKIAKVTIEETIAEVVNLKLEEIKDDKKLAHDLRLDSIKRLELISDIEQKYNVSINETDITLKTTVADLKNLIKNKKELKKKNQNTFWQINLFSKIIRQIFQQILFLLMSCFEKITFHSKTILPKKSFIFIANHSSHLDAPTLLKVLGILFTRKIILVVAEDYFFEKSFLSFCMRLFFNAIPIDRDGNIEQTLHTLGFYIDLGYSVLIFPEGTRSRDGKIAKFKPGIGFIAKEMQVPVVPIQIKGTYELLPKGSRFPRNGAVIVSIGEPITFPKKESYVAIAESLEDLIRAL